LLAAGAFFVLLSGSVRVTGDRDAAEGASPLGGSAGAPAAPGALGVDAPAVLSPPPPRTKWTRRVPHPVLIGHAASLPP